MRCKNVGYDAVVVGAGPNGLAAAIAVARAGRSVVVLEAAETPGGGARTLELTLPGFRHDVCSALHPLAVGSPFLSELPLEAHGLEWIHPRYPVAHPLDDGSAVALERDVDTTADALTTDARAYRRVMFPLVRDWSKIASGALGPLRLPRNPVAMGRFGLRGAAVGERIRRGVDANRAGQSAVRGHRGALRRSAGVQRVSGGWSCVAGGGTCGWLAHAKGRGAEYH